MKINGSICEQYVRCGRANCRCARGELHGPYYYRFYRENGQLKKEYLKCQNHQKEISVALEKRQRTRQARQERQTVLDNEMEAISQLMDEMVCLAREAEAGIWNAKEARQAKVIEQVNAMVRKTKPLPK